MLNEHDFTLEIGMLLVLRYRILGVEGFWSPEILAESTDNFQQPDIKGAIYRAQDLVHEDIEQWVHILERFAYTNDPTLRQSTLGNLEIEADVLAMKNHPVLPTILDFFTSSHRAYLITKFEQGTNLNAVIHSPTFRDIDLKTITDWTIDLCDAIACLHENDPPMLFRVLEADKLNISDAGDLYINDLSGVGFIENGTRGIPFGIDGYAAPEQYAGEHSPQSDIYSIGAVLHYLLTGRDPIHAKRFSFVDRPVRQLNPKVSKDLDMIVYKALAYDPKFRFKSVGEMQEALSTL